jgi:hypothetical protein
LPSGGFDPAVVLAWIGTDRSHHLNMETSPDGINFQNKIVLNESSITRPSVLVVPSPNGNAAVIAWTGTDRSHHLNVIYDVYGSPHKIVLPETSPFAPSLAYFNEQIWISWSGTNGSRTLNVLGLGPQGLTPGTKTTLWSYGSVAAPDLFTDSIDSTHSQLGLAWPMQSTYDVDILQSSDGANWAAQSAPLAPLSPFSPSVMAISQLPANSPDYFLCWADWNDIVQLAPSNTPPGFNLPGIPVLQSTIGSPALGYNRQNGQIFVAWTDTSHHMNVVMLVG